MKTIDDFTRPLEYISPMDDLLGTIFREWVENDVIPFRRRFDEDYLEHHLIHPPFNKLLGEYGIQRMLFPEDLGGWGLGTSNYLYVAAYCMFEEIARADSGMAMAFGVVFWPLLFISLEPHVNRRLLEEFAPMFCGTRDATFAALCMTEPQGGADIENVEIIKGSTIQTTAVRDGDEWVINGHKLWPTNTGGLAKLMAVVCTTNPGSDDPHDIAVIYVKNDMPGVTQGPPYEKAGMSSDMNGDVWFENVRVPLWYRAIGPGDDAKYFGEVMSTGNMGIIAWVSGIMMNIFERISEYVDRKMYCGKPLKENDAVAGLLADFTANIEAIRIIGYQCARMCDRHDLYGPLWDPGLVAKMRAQRYFAVDRFIDITGKVMNLMEAYGTDRDWDVEKHWRDAKILQLVEGSKQLCQMEVARWFYDCETL
ncbi:MAG: acyl-CoA/acyl-ACP dehydrogenase [Actinobacteria bacterium]|nr:acyl-CoA/acyl-ACP dehydrogenase [Actinomycetota bacterium]